MHVPKQVFRRVAPDEDTVAEIRVGASLGIETAELRANDATRHRVVQV